MAVLNHELKSSRKTLLIWSLCVGLTSFGCILLFESLAESMADMAGFYASMGIFAKALGMDRLSIATMEGFYATEIGLIFSVGGAMYAAMTGASMLSKEEEGHTGEFLYTLPLGRAAVLCWKYAATAVLVLLFQVICTALELTGFALAGEGVQTEVYVLYHFVQFLMQLEIGSLCFLLSAVSRKKQIGAALGLALLLYLGDLLSRIMPTLKRLRYVTPYYFSNASDIFVRGRADVPLLLIGCAVTAAAVLLSAYIYNRRDLQG